MNLDDKCYSLQMGESSSREGSCWVGACWVGTNFSEKEKGHNTLFYDQNRKLYVYADFYQVAQKMGTDSDDELRVFLADRYVEIAEFAKDFSSYLSDGIKMAADDLRAGKHYVFHEERVKIGTRNFGYQIFRGDLSEQIAADNDQSVRIFDVTAVSLFDDRLRKKMRVYCNRGYAFFRARMYYIPDLLKEDESYDAYFVSE